MELHRTATDLERQQVTADRFEGSAAGGCVQMRQRFPSFQASEPVKLVTSRFS
ncbi:hypothetical protein [Rhizobium leguminosarum]|uniref:hypothetical protein n=1 Tax=Rhizobium leguminosarum TaxID=384 RepID=UPI0024B354EE|nr:hypothetical protein [Rhizobium leguminosarum]WHO82607.1 hypothetical protein QMO81_005478 [Rhizobium leguminosarum]